MPEAKPKLLVVEDDQGLQAQLKWAYENFDVVPATDRASASSTQSTPRSSVLLRPFSE